MVKTRAGLAMGEDRERFLRAVYEETGGDRFNIVSMWDVGEGLGYEKDYIKKVVQFLDGEGLVEHKTIGGGIAITHEGVGHVESGGQREGFGTPVNILNIGTVWGSQVIQGDQTQNPSFSNNMVPRSDSPKDILEFVSVSIKQSDLPEDLKSEILGNLNTAECQVGLNNPSETIVEQALSSAKRVLEGSGSIALASQLMPYIDEVIKSFG